MAYDNSKKIGVGTTANDKKGDSLRTAFTKVNNNFEELYTKLGLLTDTSLNLGAFTFTGSTMSTDDSTNIVIDKPITVNGEITVDGDITPKTNFGASLGTPTKQFKSLYVSTNTVFLGGVPLSLDPNNNELTINNVPISQTINYEDIPNVPIDVSDLTDTEGLLGGGGNSFDQDLNTDDSVTFDSVGATTVNVSQINGTNPGDELVIQANNHNWTFDTNGNLTFPQGTLLGYSDPGGFIINGAVDKDIAIYTYSGANAHGWTFGTDGSLTIPGDIKSNGNINIDINLSDSTLRRWQFGEDGNLTLPAGGDIVDSSGQSVLGGGSGSSTVVRQDTPPSADNGTLWFNTVEGRLYIKYSDVWVDAAPLMTPAPDTDIDVASITFPDASVQTTAFTGTASTDRLVNGANTVSLGSTGALTLPNGSTIGDADTFAGVPITTARGTILLGNSPEIGQADHFHIMKGGQQNLDLFLGDDSNYVKLPSTGGVEIASQSFNQYSWIFGTDGSLQIPGDITGNNDINITVDSGDSSSYTWNFGQTGNLTLPNGMSIDSYGTSGVNAFLEIGGDDTSIGIDNDGAPPGLTITTNGTGGMAQRVWRFDPDGDLTLPAGGDILDSNGNSVLGGGDDNNIWVQTFVSNDPAVDFPNISTSVEYDSEGNVIALFVHTIDLTGERYFTVGKYTAAGTKIWTARLSDDTTTDGWGLAVDNAGGWIYVAGVVDGAGYPHQQATLTKIDAATGGVEWYRIYDFGYDSTSAVVDVDSSGNPVMVGYVDIDPEVFAQESYLAITKVNKTTGAVTWSRKLDGQADEQAYGMAMGPTGEVVAVGYMDTLFEEYSVTANALGGGSSTISIVKGSYPQPQIGWHVFSSTPYTFNSLDDVLIGSVTDDGANWILGNLTEASTGNPTTYGTPNVVTLILVDSSDTDDRMVVVKYLSDGTIDWQRAIQFDAGWTSTGADADIDSQGNVYICGQYTFELDGGPGSGSAIGIVKLDSSGAKQWSRRVVGDCVSLASSIVVGPDDKLYISGITGNDVGDVTYTWLVAKFDFDGLVEWQRFIENTSSWTFSGQFFGGEGGGSNLAVRQGYVALAGGFGDLEAGDEPMAAVLQVSSTGNVFSVGNWNFTSSSLSSTLNSTASDITVINAGLTDSNNVSAITSSVVGITTEVGNFLIGTVLTAPGGNDSLVNGAYLVSLSNTGVVTLPAGGTITEGYVTSNPTIQLTPASPDVASQKLVIKGGGSYTASDNGIGLNWYIIDPVVNDTVEIYVNSPDNADQTLYWWIYPEGAGIATPESGTVSLGEGGAGNFSFTVDSDDYEFTVRVSPESNNYDPATGVETQLFNSSAPTLDADHHLHLTTGDLTETSIFLGTDDHNVRTTVNGGIEITTPNTSNNVWQFGTDGNLTVPGDIRSEGNINIDINLSDSTLRRWSFGEDGDLTFPDATVQTTAHIQGEQIFTVDTGATAYAPTAVDFNLLLVFQAAGYLGTDPISVTLPTSVPGQRLVIYNGLSLVTLTVNPGPFGRDISGGVIAEFIYSSTDGWIPLYGTNSPT
jgi:hypothetical protein